MDQPQEIPLANLSDDSTVTSQLDVDANADEDRCSHLKNIVLIIVSLVAFAAMVVVVMICLVLVTKLLEKIYYSI